MATTNCPRCKVRVHSTKDKSTKRWQWNKKKNTYVCLACEAELLAKELKTDRVVYTEAILRQPAIHLRQDLKLKPKKSRRTKKLCQQCKEVTFLIGVAVYGDNPKLLVCSNKCKLRRRKQDREEAAA